MQQTQVAQPQAYVPPQPERCKHKFKKIRDKTKDQRDLWQCQNCSKVFTTYDDRRTTTINEVEIIER